MQTLSFFFPTKEDAMEQKVLRTGTFVVVCAIVLRLASGMIGTAHTPLSPKIAGHPTQ